jgi:hypothetical protein
MLLAGFKNLKVCHHISLLIEAKLLRFLRKSFADVGGLSAIKNITEVNLKRPA